ncbi:Oxidation resistance protein 1 [Caenorhabditis elegans]|uniref:Oxidation resistance protein 1 n=2 Tax=Caenorhabditis elegans TaxID=6239 RepID=A0A486WXA9_CAEEL|nr:LysM domain-containing protein [Caenorhabditis elegans]VGM69531.1 LysM domain-containing protein [Caenorhabditis elegans]
MWRSRIPRGNAMDYTITETDTLERVAASHDCTVGELMKLNKMASRMVFPGQKILVPLANADDVFDPPSSASSLKSSGNQISGIENAEDGIRKGPGGAVPAHVRRGSFTKTQSAPIPRGSNDEADTDCLQRFLKIKVKQVTESDGTVSGTLLVTPNCLMFDPDVSHPLVKENGPDLYGMVANMDEIQSVSVYKEISGLTGDKAEKKRDIFDPDHLRTPEDSPKKQIKQNGEIEIAKNEEVAFEAGSVDSNHSPKFGSDIALPAISEETKDSPCEEAKGDLSRNRSATLGDEEIQLRARSRTSSQASSNDERPRSFSELDTPSEGKNIGRFSPNAARRSFGKLGRTLSARAKSIQGTVTSGAEKVVGTAVQGTKTVAHGVVTHTKSAADTLQSGIENGAKAAADVAGRVVDKGQSLMSESINGVTEIFSVPDFEQPAKSPLAMKREQSLAKLQDLRRQTAEARENSAKENHAGVFRFACATSSDEAPDLFAAVDEIMERNRIQSNDSTASQSPILPFYMAVRLTRNKKKKKSSTSSPSYDEDIAFGNKLKREFWFAVPRNQADNIYHFLLQWSPDKYGLDTTTSTTEEPSSVMSNDGQDKGFIVLGSNADESLGGEKSTPLFGSSLLNREWELVTVSEMCRRLSLDQELELPIPDGAATSQILDELMIRQVMDILPPRAEGYPWVNIYNSEKHGFSLATMYRKMAEFDEDLSPVLLIIRDTKEHVFGAVVSSAIRPNDHFFGTGDSCLLWRFTGEVPHTRELRQYNWTGDNQYFVNAAKDSLSIGAGSGRNGLWLDADLNHGSSQKCETFDNEPLCGDDQDFIIQFIEAYGFRM